MRIHDPDEWESKVEHRPCTACGGGLGRCNGCCNGSVSYSQVRRSKAEVMAIKAERQRKEEEEILAKADAIRAGRRATPTTEPAK